MYRLSVGDCGFGKHKAYLRDITYFGCMGRVLEFEIKGQ